jgi:hypothetical protein
LRESSSNVGPRLHDVDLAVFHRQVDLAVGRDGRRAVGATLADPLLVDLRAGLRVPAGEDAVVRDGVELVAVHDRRRV